MRARVFVCPNPKCRKKIEEPILLNNSSTIPTEYYYVCPHCFTKLNTRVNMRGRANLSNLSLTAFGSIILVWVGWLAWCDMTMWGTDIALIFFGSRDGEAISLGIGMKVIQYFLIGLVLLLLGLLTFLRRRSEVIELHFDARGQQESGKRTFRENELEMWKKIEKERFARRKDAVAQKWFKHNPFIAEMVYGQTTWNKSKSKFHAWLLDCKVNYFPCFLYMKPSEAGITQKQAIKEICSSYHYEVGDVKEENICHKLRTELSYGDLYVKYAGELWRAYLNLRRLKGIKGYTRNIFLVSRRLLWEEYNKKERELEEICEGTPEGEIPRDCKKKLKVENVGLW